ncbi:replication protein [Escherichia albertii]|uniref:replication protein n=1 Tax=Escherichia albertii TaxID=208962 RepID=UPI000F5DF2E1|nr:replication protein [Escherichia albertii]QSZ87105.1 replication protein [Escherichia albertii]QSZ91488.1 replication protein [Escherichia albertii]QSZ95900.1 replication protein [Escherichia albertii]QTA00281.1 replication protein [Escherichia albertii]QTA04680.1 replication protein [Escherichia albertii]
MANTAEIFNFPVPDVAQKERRVADLDDGYTRIANELLEAVMLAGLTQHQLLVFLAVMRKTYGFNKKLDWVSNEQLSELTGILPHKCSAAKSVLVKRGILIQSGSKWGTAEDLTAAEWMFDMVKTIAPSARKPNFAGWANDIRLMRERDGRNHRDMCVLFRWACQDNFWSGNVLSPAKLRDKWTQLEINRNKQQAGVTASKPKLDLTNTDWIYGVDL